MPASFCPNCKEIVLIYYAEELLDNQVITTITCRKCHRELSRNWETKGERINQVLLYFGLIDTPEKE